MQDPATLACSLVSPSNLYKTDPAPMLSLDWAAIHDGAPPPPHFSFLVRDSCSDLLSTKGTIPIDICQLCKVYGPQCMDI